MKDRILQEHEYDTMLIEYKEKLEFTFAGQNGLHGVGQCVAQCFDAIDSCDLIETIVCLRQCENSVSA